MQARDHHPCFPSGVEVFRDGDEFVIGDESVGDYRWLRTVPNTDCAHQCKEDTARGVALLMNTLGELGLSVDDAVKVLKGRAQK